MITMPLKFKSWKILAGLIIFVLIIIAPSISGLSPQGQRMLAVAALMAFWWVTEAVNITVTSLLPLVLFPVLGIADAAKAAAPYANHLIYLFMGGFMIAIAIQKWNLHKRISLLTIRLIGFSQSKLLLGFMVSTAFLSMWISNTASTMIMVPIAMAVLDRTEQNLGEEPKVTKFGSALMLGTAYSASVGGIATLIGTPPNLVLANTLETMYGYRIDFTHWLMVGLPILVIFLPLIWIYLSKISFKLSSSKSAEGERIIRSELKNLGPMTVEEKRVMTVFIMTVLFWIFAESKNFGTVTIPGLSSLFPGISDATIAMFGAILLFFLPAGKSEGGNLLHWKDAKQLPWGILILFGGGLALATGFKITGLAEWIGASVESFASFPHIILTIIVITIIIFLTELTSNTATTAMILPILAGIAVGIGENPLLLMAPAAIAASCAFMLPVATPPNAIVFGSGQVTIPMMAKKGFVLNLIGIVLITVLTYTILIHAFGVVLGELPVWVK